MDKSPIGWLMSVQDKFIQRVERWLKRTGTSHRQFGLATMSDPNFVKDIREGRSPGARTIDKIDNWMAEHPSGVLNNMAESNAA